jgi:hypothetical protein
MKSYGIEILEITQNTNSEFTKTDIATGESHVLNCEDDFKLKNIQALLHER